MRSHFTNAWTYEKGEVIGRPCCIVQYFLPQFSSTFDESGSPIRVQLCNAHRVKVNGFAILTRTHQVVRDVGIKYDIGTQISHRWVGKTRTTLETSLTRI